MAKTVKYGVGEQSFPALREGGFLYVDKTQFIEKIVNESKYYFLGRPRRFGKSLFLSTLKCFFEGKRELFKGLYADIMDWDWEPYPVLHIALNMWDYTAPGVLEQAFNAHLLEWEKRYDVKDKFDDISARFREVIKSAYEKTGKRVVILVDEYDNPLIDSLGNRELFDHYRNRLSAIYSNFKSSADYIRLVFLTGVSRFGKVSIFSGLNNIKDISFDEDFTEICGLTDEEIDRYFQSGIQILGDHEGLTPDEVRKELKRYYDGYHFSRNWVDIYNPFSFICAIDRKDISNYWIQSGRTEFVSRQIVKNKLDLETFFNSRCTRDTLIGIEPDSPNPLALLYQSGYLTIKEYNDRAKIFTLGLPNTEVKEGLIDNLLPFYSSIKEHEAPIVVDDMQ